MLARIAPPLTVACAGLLWMACNSCPLGLLDLLGPPPTLPQTIECCGASLHVDVTVPDVDELQVDLAITLFPGQDGHVDVWLTDVSCAELFDATYPSGTPRCRTLNGPVQVNTVSSRVSVQPDDIECSCRATARTRRRSAMTSMSACGGAPAARTPPVPRRGR